MNIVSTVKQWLTPSNKLEKLASLIDSITVQDDKVHIKLSRDIIIENSGNTVTISGGMSITIATEIHLNPVLPIFPNDDLKKVKWSDKGHYIKKHILAK